MDLMEWWLSVWMVVISAAAVIALVVMAVKWHKWPLIRKLVCLGLVVLVCHVWEEWYLPGGFHWSFNGGGEMANWYPMSTLTDMLTCLLGVIYYVVVLWKLWDKKAFPLSLSYLALLEFLIHTSTSLGNVGTYGAFYGPGFVTATLGFLPIAVTVLAYYITADRPTRKQVFASIGIFIIGIFGGMVMLPQALFADPETPYRYADAGWYQAFLDGGSHVIPVWAYLIAAVLTVLLIAVGIRAVRRVKAQGVRERKSSGGN